MPVTHSCGPLVCERTAKVSLENGDEVTLHEVTSKSKDGDFHTVGYTFTAEDGRLMAAAPDLVDALERAYAHMKELYDYCGEDDAQIAEHFEVMNLAAFAFLKATGRDIR